LRSGLSASIVVSEGLEIFREAADTARANQGDSRDRPPGVLLLGKERPGSWTKKHKLGDVIYGPTPSAGDRGTLLGCAICNVGDSVRVFFLGVSQLFARRRDTYLEEVDACKLQQQSRRDRESGALSSTTSIIFPTAALFSSAAFFHIFDGCAFLGWRFLISSTAGATRQPGRLLFHMFPRAFVDTSRARMPGTGKTKVALRRLQFRENGTGTDTNPKKLGRLVPFSRPASSSLR
jgi:hypothetical protein